jgi:hypothetical protein
VALEAQQAPRLFCFVSQRVWADTWTDYANVNAINIAALAEGVRAFLERRPPQLQDR